MMQGPSLWTVPGCDAEAHRQEVGWWFWQLMSSGELRVEQPVVLSCGCQLWFEEPPGRTGGGDGA
jgi:hypothetical protein